LSYRVEGVKTTDLSWK